MHKTHSGRAAAILAVVGFMGCFGDRGTAPSPQAPSATLGTVTISPINAIMAVGGTLQISATGASLSGTPIAEFDSVMYYLPSLGDTARVRISPSGLVTALASTGFQNPVLLYVIAFKGGLAKEDQVTIQVTDAAIPGVSSLSIHPTPPDSAKLAQGSAKFLVPVIENAGTGASVDNPTLRLTVKPADASKVLTWISGAVPPTLSYDQVIQYVGDICCGTWNLVLAKTYTGNAWIYASANVYGTDLKDSVLFSFSPRYQIAINIANVFGSFEITGNGNTAAYVASGGTVTISNSLAVTLGLPVSVVFDDPSAALPESPGSDSGNVVGLGAGQRTVRKFVTPGTYHWTATVGGSLPPYSGQTTTGTVIVQP